MTRLLLAPLFLITSGCNQNYTNTLRYSDFIESVQEKEVSRVLIYPQSGIAQFVDKDGVRYEVNLAPDKDLLKVLTENNVDIAVIPTRIKKIIHLENFELLY